MVSLREGPAVPVRAVLPLPGTGRGYWAGTDGDGLWQYALHRPPRRVPALPATLEVTTLAYAAGSGLWMGTAADGLYLLPDDTTLPVRHLTTAEGLLHNIISALLADHSGRRWVGTHGTGLAVYPPATQHFAYFRLNSGGVTISSFAEDATGRIWVGTEGQGIYCLTGNSWRHYDANYSLSTNFGYGLLPLPAFVTSQDAGSWLLLSHLQELTLFSPHGQLHSPGCRQRRPGARLPGAVGSGQRPPANNMGGHPGRPGADGSRSR